MVFRWLADRRRTKILKSEFPAAWTSILESNVGAYPLLSADEQHRLRQLVQVFVAEKHFEGCGGLELTDEMRVTIAGTGCLMLLGRDHDLFSEVESILVYPSTIVARDLGRSVFDTSGRVVDEGQTVLGQAVQGGAVILAWDSALQGAKDARDGRNVVIHELAHKIDFIDGAADGTPEFETHAERRAWSAALEPAFLAHKARATKGKKSFLDDYAVTNEAEYFAVASEAFFEQPRAFAKQLPDVYKSLAAFYNLDLATRAPDDAKATANANAKKPAARPKRKAPSRKSSPALAAPPTPTFRKTAAMAVVALSADVEASASPAPKANAPTRKGSPAVAAPTARGKSAATIAVPTAAIEKATRGKSSAAITLPPVDGKPARGRSSAAITLPAVDRKPARGKSSAAITVPTAAIEKATRGRSSAAITLPPVDGKPARGRSSAATALPPVDGTPARGRSSAAVTLPIDGTSARGKSSAAIAVPQAAIEKTTRRKSSAAIAVPTPAVEKATRGRSSAAIALPPVDGRPARGRSSAAIAVPTAAIEKTTRGKSSAAIGRPPVNNTPAARGKSR